MAKLFGVEIGRNNRLTVPQDASDDVWMLMAEAAAEGLVDVVSQSDASATYEIRGRRRRRPGRKDYTLKN